MASWSASSSQTAGPVFSSKGAGPALATRVDHVVCAHPLEAQVRELRLLAAHKPPYNRRSRNRHNYAWAVLTDEAFPRLSVVRRPRDGALGRLSVERADGEGIFESPLALALAEAGFRMSPRGLRLRA